MSTPENQTSSKKRAFQIIVIALLVITTPIVLYFYILLSPSTNQKILYNDTDEISALQQQQQQLAQQIAALQTALPHTAETGKTEVLYYLRLADTSATILRDIPTAIALLQRAKTQTNSNPVHSAELLQAIDEDIQALESVQLPNFQTLAQTIANMEQEAATLPFKDEVTQKTTENQQPAMSFWQSVWHDIASVLQYVVKVNRTDTGAVPYFLFPEQKALLREQLRVQLEQLLLAAMGYDTLLYQSKIKEIRNAVNYFFATDQEQTQKFLQQLEGLEKEVLVPTMPQANKGLLLLEQTP
jgi:uncharacterized protein HemX